MDNDFLRVLKKRVFHQPASAPGGLRQAGEAAVCGGDGDYGRGGAATFRWSQDGGLTWEAGGLVSGDWQHPVTLEDDLAVAWEGGDGRRPGGGGFLDVLGR